MYVYVFNGVTYGQEIFSGYRIYGFSVLCAGFPGGTGTADSGISVGLGCVSCLWLCLEIRYPKTLAHYHHFPIEGRTSLYSEDIIGVNTNRDSRKEWLLMYVLFFWQPWGIAPSVTDGKLRLSTEASSSMTFGDSSFASWRAGSKLDQCGQPQW